MEIEGVQHSGGRDSHQISPDKDSPIPNNSTSTSNNTDTTPACHRHPGLDDAAPARTSPSSSPSLSPPPADASDPPSTPPPAANAKKRKLAELQSASRSRSASRPPSPPWKSFAANGPTQFLDNGKRRSGRVNAPPPSPLDKPIPSAKKSAAKASAKKGSALKNAHTTHQTSPPKPKPSVAKSESTPSQPSRASARLKNLDTSPVKDVKKEQEVAVPVAAAVVAAVAPITSSPQAKRKAGRPRKSLGLDGQVDNDVPPASRTVASPEKSQTTPRIKLKLKRPQFSFTPTHPGHIAKSPPFASLDETIDHYDRKIKEAATQSREDDRYEGLERRLPERIEQRPEELAEKEARTRLRILDAAQPGGPLSEEKCSMYLPDDQKEPSHQYHHWDHVWAHGVYLKSLLDREKRTHMETAKRLAHACLARWREKQPQTEEELEKQENEWFRLIYRQTVKDVQRKWELIGAEIDRKRAARYEEEQRIERELKMQDMLEKSTTLLDRRRVRLDSELSVDGDDESMSGEDSVSRDDSSLVSGEEGDEDHHLTSSESETSDQEAEEDPDANLSPEALRRKYGNIPDVTRDPSEDEANEMDVDEDNEQEETMLDTPIENQDEGDTGILNPAEGDRDYSKVQLDEVDDALLDESDESTDMSDDDMTSEEEDDEDDGEDEEESEEEDAGLLGFFGGRKAMTQDVPPAEDEDGVDETKLAPDSGHLEQEESAEPFAHGRTSVESKLQKEPAEDPDLQHPPELSVDMDLDEPRDADDPSHRTIAYPSPDNNMLSADSHGEDRSSQMSPKDDTTIESTEAESTTSVELDDAEKTVDSTEHTPQPTKPSMVEIPSLLRGTLREYQHEGLDWLAKLYDNQTNGILADEMGLGKTIQTIALLAHLAEEHHVWGPHLIVVPTSVILNWEMEFKKFLPGFKVLSYYGSVEERAQKRKGWSNPDNWNVVITSYQLILKDLSAIRVPEWHYMILDEAHNIKNFNSQRYQAMIRLKTHARLLLTGTPLQNSIIELWSLLTFLTAGQDGQGMGDLDEFTEWFRRPVDEIFVDGKSKLGNEAQDIVNKLHHSLRPYLLRRLKSHVEQQLPGKYEHTVICRLSKRQRQLYDAFMGLSDTKAKLSSGNMISVSQALMSLRKVCNHPDLFEERPIVTSFAMTKPFSRTPRSVVADYEIKDLILRRNYLHKDPTETIDLDFLSLNLVSRESRSRYHVRRSRQLRASDAMNQLVRREAQTLSRGEFDGSSFAAVMAYQKRMVSVDRLSRIGRYAALTEQRTDFTPIYGTDLIERCTTYSTDRLRRTPPHDRMLHSEWYLDTASALHGMVKTMEERADIMNASITKFACITPNVVADGILPYMVPRKTITTVQSVTSSAERDPFHEARVRLSIAFPDKRLLQYDCGKLQRLAGLLRDLQSRGSRALIFTQMTSVLDILEQFLNIHGFRYLRLDGSTKIEQRQDMMERFNRDTRIDVFILSSRSGGVGMNLTGADAVIFYDLDWNPQMDKQCQDRAHRIGQTRDVHIYKFVSEHTIEVNILRKSNQKRLLDEVVIQEGEFTTDYFNRNEDDEGDDFAGAAVDRVFGANVGDANVTKVLEAVEDAEDVAAAHAQQKDLQADDFDFDNPNASTADVSRNSRTPKTSVPPTPIEAIPGSSTVRNGAEIQTSLEAAQSGLTGDVMALQDESEEVGHIDDYMLGLVDWLLKDVKYVAPPDKSRRGRLDRHGRDRSNRTRHR